MAIRLLDYECWSLPRPPERHHGYEQQFHSVSAQAEHEALEAKRPRMETIPESHISRAPSTTGGIIMPLPHAVHDSLRANMEVKKVRRTASRQLLHFHDVFYLSSKPPEAMVYNEFKMARGCC